jgi:anti-anti-sigma factor
LITKSKPIMQISLEKHGEYLIIKTNGRLDASWSEYFMDSCFEQIRNGQHYLIIDAERLDFVSSAGIRSMVRIHKELLKVNGAFFMINAQAFVAKTIEMTGFRHWLSKELPTAIQPLEAQADPLSDPTEHIYVLNPSASLELAFVADWLPVEMTENPVVHSLSFPNNVFALGIGGVANAKQGKYETFGEFMAIAGQVIFQAAEEKARPDYLLAEQQYIPKLEVIQALYCKGEMSKLTRFAPHGDKLSFGLAELADRALAIAGNDLAAFVILGETDGLVGATITQLPKAGVNATGSGFQEMREWLSFSGERVFVGEQALVFGIASKSQKQHRLLRPLPSNPEICGHFHASVFAYQPLQNGKIDLLTQVQKFLTGPPPRAVMHLVDDDRPATGLGQSTFIRGACWCAPIKKGEELL